MIRATRHQLVTLRKVVCEEEKNTNSGSPDGKLVIILPVPGVVPYTVFFVFFGFTEPDDVLDRLQQRLSQPARPVVETRDTS